MPRLRQFDSGLMRAGRALLQARYRIPAERICAQDWIQFNDARYCEDCAPEVSAR